MTISPATIGPAIPGLLRSGPAKTIGRCFSRTRITPAVIGRVVARAVLVPAFLRLSAFIVDPLVGADYGAG